MSATDFALLERALRRLPPDEALAVSRLAERPWQTARRRLALRAAALEAAAILLPDAPLTVRAKALARRLARYAAGPWQRRMMPPRDPLTAALHRVLDLNGGRPIGWRTIYDALQNSGVAVATCEREHAGHARPQADAAARTAATRIRDAALGGRG